MVGRLSHIILALYILICCVYSQEIKSSLTFVIDNTVSMSKNIKHVIKCADDIFDTVVNSNKSGIEDFVIVTFNDPEYKLRIITSKKEEFKSSLQQIETGGGGDCPEMSMSGIQLGLNCSRPFSYIFVFTDAKARDMHKIEIVKDVALRLNIKIHFIITETPCPGQLKSDFSAYEKLAFETGGDYFIMQTPKIPEILKYVKRLIKTRKVELLRNSFKPGEEKKVNVSLDSSITDVLVTVTGFKPSISVKNKLNTTVPTDVITKTRKAKVVGLNNTDPGSYIIELNTANSTMNTLLIVRGTSKVTFSYGFSALKPEYMNETTNRPVGDQKSYTLIKLKTESVKINLKSIQVVDLEDKILMDKPMFLIGKDQCYISEPIVFPKDTFKIVMIAEDEETNEIIKRTSLPIAPQKVFPGTMKNEAPKVTITGDSKVILSNKSPLELICRVTGYPKPKILWTDNLGSTLKYEVLTLKEEYEFVVLLDIVEVTNSNKYTCKASNNISSDEKSVQVNTTNYFEAVELSKDKKGELNKEVKLYCKVNASPPATVTWHFNGKQVVTDDNLSLSPDRSTLHIKKMKPQYVGTILCQIENAAKNRLLHKIQLTIKEAPKIDNKITEIYANKGSNAKISCRILKGNPQPTIKWFFKAKNKDSFYPIKEYKEDVVIDKVTANVVGTYKCIAKNEIDRVSHVVDLIMEYAPITLGKRHLNILKQVGQPVTIPCEIQGEPVPEINWSINGERVQNIEPYKIYKDHSMTFKASITTIGEYSCEGVNKLGSIQKTANVSVFEPVSFDVPKDFTYNITVGRKLNIFCQVNGYPIPKIRWDYFSFDGIMRSNISEKARLEISAIQANDNGFYVCIAENPFGKPKSLTYVINVEVPPSIEPEKKDVIAVEGDKGITIPCNSIGDPKPNISWIYNGKPLKTGNEHYDKNSDGSLVIKDVIIAVKGMYACVAENNFGKVFAIFRVDIQKYPLKTGFITTKFLELNKPAVVKCNVTHADTDEIRWYKNRKVVAKGDLVLPKYKNSHQGLYKCRVSNYLTSITGTMIIKTGIKPRFAYQSYQQKYKFYDRRICLICGNSALPKAKITWWKDKKKQFSSGESYGCSNEVIGVGEYKCVVENELGKISRFFYVTADECLLDIKEDLDRYHPLVLNQFNDFPNFHVKDRHLAIPLGRSAHFFCQGSFNKFTDSLLKAECVEGKKFAINGEQVDYSKLKCKEALQPVTIENKEICAQGNGVVFSIGINVKEFLEVYKICYHKKHNIPLYGEYELKSSAAGVSCALPEIWFHGDVINYNNEEMYDCKQQRSYLSAALGQDLPGEEDECFRPRQLVNERDVPAGFPQMLTHSYLNIIPQWSSDMAKNWDILEETLRTEVNKPYRAHARAHKMFIRTGISQNFRLPLGKSGVRSNMYIQDRAGRKNVLPVFLWKVITDELNSATVAIIHVIIPEALRGDNTSDYKVCLNQCDQIQWIQDIGIDADYFKSGYIFCCNIINFEKAFYQSVSFSIGYTNLLRTFVSL